MDKALQLLRTSAHVRTSGCLLHHSHLSTASQRNCSEPKPFSKIPGSKGLPVVGNAPKFIKGIEAGIGGEEFWLYKLHQEYGPIYRLRILGNTWAVFVAAPDAIETVFRSEGKIPSRGPFEDQMMWLFKKLETPTPMFFSKGEVWKNTRSNAAKQMVPRRVATFVEPLCEIAEQLLTHIDTVKDELGNVTDIRPELYKWAFQGVSHFVYNENIDIYSGKDPDQLEFMEAGMDYINALMTIIQAIPVYRLYKNKTYRDYEAIVRRMQKAGKGIIHRRHEELRHSISSGIEDETKLLGLLDQWLIEGKFTEEEALSQSFDMLSAGIDTTSSSASFLLYEIAKQPALQEQLVKEISSAIGDCKAHPSWEDLQKMTLLRNCVKEVMRLYTPTGGTSRTVAEDVVLLGYQVPAGTTVHLDLFAVTRDHQVFESPNEFKPDRWNKDAAEKIHPFSSLPFGFGPRSCYGRRLAELEMYILLAKMLPKYQITTNVKEMKLEHKLLIKPNGLVHLNFQQRIIL